MNDTEQGLKKQLNGFKTGVIVLAVLLLIAIIGNIIYMNRSGRLSGEKDQLLTERENLRREINGLNESVTLKDAIIEEKDETIEQLKEEHAAVIADKDARIATLGWRVTTRSNELEEALEENTLLIAEKEELEIQQEMLSDELNALRQELNELASAHDDLLAKTETAKPLNVYNISLLTTWERLICADRYNVSKARRVDFTRVNFELDGTVFSEPGTREVHLVMIKPDFSIVNPSEDELIIKDTGEPIRYTEVRQVNYDDDVVFLEFNIPHTEKLDAGTYDIQVYVDGKLARSKELILN